MQAEEIEFLSDNPDLQYDSWLFQDIEAEYSTRTTCIGNWWLGISGNDQ